MDYAFYRNLFRKIKANNAIYHSGISSINLQSPEFVNSGDFQITLPCFTKFNFDFGNHHILCAGEEPYDVALELIAKKTAWLKKMKKLQPTNERDSLRELKQFRDGVTRRMSVRLRRYIEHMRSDPIPGFECDKNWLYSGSTITTLPVNNDGNGVSLLSASGQNLSQVSMLKLNDEGDIADRLSMQLKINDPVLQIIADPGSSLVCARQKNNLSIIEPTDRGFVVKIKKKVRRSNYFTSAALRNGKVAVAKNLGKVALFDIQANKLSFATTMSDSQLKCPMKDSWSQIHWREDELWVLKQKMLCHIDPRGNQSKWDISESLEDCENICNYFESSRDQSSCYLATTHNLFHIDVRQQKPLHKWAHLMKETPSYGQGINTGEEELVILQSPDAGECIAIGCGPDLVQVPPKMVLGITDSLRSAQLKGLCLDPDAAKRALYTITGTHAFPCGDSLQQVTQNAGGDIFIRSIGKPNQGSTMEVDKNEEEDNTKWESWNRLEDIVYKNSRPHCSDIVDMTNAFDLLKIPFKEGSPVPPTSVDWAIGEQVIPETLHLFKDVLVEPILEIWNVENNGEEEEEEKFSCSELRVEEWLSKHMNG